jgi:hypothetical protein
MCDNSFKDWHKETYDVEEPTPDWIWGIVGVALAAVFFGALFLSYWNWD